MHICAYICTYACKCEFVLSHTHACMCTHIYTYKYIYIYTYMWVCVRAWTDPCVLNLAVIWEDALQQPPTPTQCVFMCVRERESVCVCV